MALPLRCLYHITVIVFLINCKSVKSNINYTACMDWQCSWKNQTDRMGATDGDCIFWSNYQQEWIRPVVPSGPIDLTVTCDRAVGTPKTMFQCIALLVGATRIRSLELFTCDSVELSDGDLDPFMNLEELRTQYGFISRIDDNVFISTEHLKTIELVQDHGLDGITDYPRALIGPPRTAEGTGSHSANNFLPSLRNLHLENFGFSTVIPDDAFLTLSHLTNLSLVRVLLTDGDFLAMTALTNLQQLAIRDNPGVTSVPTFLFQRMPDLSFLEISHTLIAAIVDGDLSNLSNLRSLDLSSNILNDIYPDAFSSLESLSSLDLHGNSLLGLNGYTLSINEIPHLEKLILEDCYLSDLSYTDFKNLTALKELLLKGNKLSEIPAVFANFDDRLVTLKDLEKIDLGQNLIAQIGSYTFSYVLRLKSIDLADNYVRHIKENTFVNLASIEQIDLQHNLIETIDHSAFRGVTTLRVLDLRYNRLTGFPLLPYGVNWDLGINGLPTNPFNTYLEGNPLICDCSMFYTLFEQDSSTGEWGLPFYSAYIWPGNNLLYNQQFDRTRLSCYTQHANPLLVSLETMMTSETSEFYDKITSEVDCQPPCLCYYQCKSGLVFVLCQNASLLDIPANVTSAVNIMHLASNSINTLKQNSFSNFPNIFLLNLANNNISYIEGGSFLPLGNLLYLYLNNNEVTEVNSIILNFTSSDLSLVDLSNNQIALLENDTFSEMSSVQNLSLSNNQISVIPDGVFDQLHNLTGIFLSGNPLNCSCDILYLTSWYKQVVFTDGIALTTDVPSLPCDDVGFSNETELARWVEDQEVACSPQPTAFIVMVEVSQLPHQQSAQWYVLVLSVFLAVFFTALISLLIYRYRLEILVFLYVKTGLKPFSSRSSGDDEDKEYDAFISFSSLDRDFVLGELIPKLETAESGKRSLCIHHRDFIVGECIATNIINAIENSRKILIICSKNYLESEWCSYEFKTSHHQALKDRTRRIVLVLMEDVEEESLDKEIKAYISTNTYLHRRDVLFWSKLLYSIPQSKCSDSELKLEDPDNRNESQLALVTL